VGHVIIGMDPHKRSATIEIIDDRETVLAAGRFGTDRDVCRSETRFGLRGLRILVHQTAEDLAAADPSGVQVDDW
jgi:hypothetical protein